MDINYTNEIKVVLIFCHSGILKEGQGRKDTVHHAEENAYFCLQMLGRESTSSNGVQLVLDSASETHTRKVKRQYMS